MKTVTTVCEHCKTEFEKDAREHSRSIKRGAKHFCKIACAVSFRNLATNSADRLKPYFGANGLNGRKIDSLSPFRWHMARLLTRKRDKGRAVEVDAHYLKDQWEKQQGICPYAGVKMSLVTGTLSEKNDDPSRASLDRIDSTKGYIQGNVEFVCVSINLGKNGFSKDQMLKFIDSIKKSASL